MCRSNVHPTARAHLASLLADIAEALDPGHGDTVVIGPVDFGSAEIIQFPAEHTIACARCERISDTFSDAEELTDALLSDGWEIGGSEFCDLCPVCVEDLDARAMRRR